MPKPGATPNHLRALRKALKMSMIPFSVQSGVSYYTLSCIEVHGYYPSAEIRARLATYLDVPESEIWPHLAEPVSAGASHDVA